MSQTWVSVEELAATLHVSPKTIRGLIRRGELKAVKVGRVVRLSPETIEAWQAAHTMKPRPSEGARP